MAYLAAENWASNHDIQDLEYQNDFPNSIDCSKILDSLLDESQEDYYCNEDDGRLNSLIQSLEAEIITTNSGKCFDGDQSSCSSIEVDFMDMEDSSSSSNADNFNLDNVESCTIGSFDMLDFEETSNYSSQMMCQRVPYSFGEGTDESYV
ncbi:hypothetical protein LIER_24467 [Lithospermum erythrorhizon]|uniref:Uncharacterized protein n=1 Tax=Lithospermum erythrorhizon TaxID=34254 RepID=A0AAV3R4I0_LITER